MAKLSKMQAQAIISKLGREANNLRDKLIEEEKAHYTPSEEAKKLAELIAKRDKLRTETDAAVDETKRLAEVLGITGYHNYIKAEDALTKLKDAEIQSKYPKVDLDAALDNLIIESVEDNFSVDSFIEFYLKQLRK